MAYEKTIWQKGDVIDAEKLNKIEKGIGSALNQLESLTGLEYNSTEESSSSEEKQANITANGNLTIGNSESLTTTALYTNTTNYGTFTVGTSSAEKKTTLNGDLDVTGATTLTNTLTIGTSSVTREVKIYGPLTVSGSMTLNNNSVATQQYVTDTINNLNVSAITGAQSKTLTQISETNGKISATFDNILISESQVTDLTTHLDQKAPLASPAFTGTPTAITATAGTNNTQIATTAFVNTAITNATNNLTSSITGTAGVSKTLTSLSQTDGIISAEFSDIAINGSQVTITGDLLEDYFVKINNDGHLVKSNYNEQALNLQNIPASHLIMINNNGVLIDSGIEVPPTTTSGDFTLRAHIENNTCTYSWVPVSQGE